MLYYSEKLNKTYETEQDCLDAEKKHEEEQLMLREAEADRKKAISKRKSEMASKIEATETALTSAYDNLKEAREQCRTLREEYNNKVAEILTKAKEEVKKAENDRFEALAAFNREFGKYTVSLSDADAVKEWQRSLEWINSIFGNFFF